MLRGNNLKVFFWVLGRYEFGRSHLSQQQMKPGRGKRVEIKTEKKKKKKKGRNILVLYQITTGMKGFMVFSVLLWKILHQLVLAFSFKYIGFLSLQFFFTMSIFNIH